MVRSSNIRVSVHFNQQAVFAGEELECTITFTNHADNPSGREERPPPSARRISDATLRQTQATRHKQLQQAARDIPYRPSLDGGGALEHVPGDTAGELPKRRPHGRSISIISLQPDDIGDSVEPRTKDAWSRNSTPGHSRAASVQAQPARQREINGSESNKRSSLPPSRGTPPLVFPRGINEANETRQDSRQTRSRQNVEPTPAFKFPASPLNESYFPDVRDQITEGQPLSIADDIDRRHSPGALASAESNNPISHLIHGTSVNGGTPRSSIEIYSGSNHSDETVASEYPLHQSSRQPVRANAFRHKLEDVVEDLGPEHLMMGYAQVTGNFTLEASLINQNPFEEIKRRSVVSGQGAGGVVGLERRKRDSGLLGGFGWSNLGESIGELLGAGEMSSIKEMRNKASSKTIPLLSTPHSILFVDLRLSPGESRKYSYKLTLPKGLPPTHKGRAMKVTYSLQIGIQRPGSRSDQRVNTIEIPFKMFGTINARGDILSYDLLKPHIFLKDLAHTSSISSDKPSPQPSSSDLPSFLAYVDTLLHTNTTASGLLSPTVPNTPHMRRHSSMADVRTSKEAIDLAVLRSHQAQQSSLSTKFTITRSSRPVATLMLPRSAYRLGETINLIADFSHSSPKASPDSVMPSSPNHIPVYAMLVTLESHEIIDPSIAMRSPQSICRYTRKIHAQASENALFARRLCFSLAIPPSATPEFKTSGVTLEWRIRVEFMTPLVRAARLQTLQPDDEDDEGDGKGEFEDANVDLMEVVASDDRGQVLQGIEQMYVDTFEVLVPLRIYGAIVGNGTESDVDGLPV